MIAWDLDKADWRLYRLDRMTPKFPPGGPFTRRPIPTGDAGTFLSARLKGSGGGNAWPCYGELLIELPAADIAPWLGDGELEQVSDAACRVRVGSWSWAGLMSWALRFDAQFTVLGPEAFRNSISGLAARVAAADPGPGATA